ncbi:hypothetical protein VPH35_125157 [Triticum aestivum]
MEGTPAVADFVVSSTSSLVTVHQLQLWRDAGAHGGVHGDVPRLYLNYMYVRCREGRCASDGTRHGTRPMRKRTSGRGLTRCRWLPCWCPDSGQSAWRHQEGWGGLRDIPVHHAGWIRHGGRADKEEDQ